MRVELCNTSRMSTTYEKVLSLRGPTVCVEAYGASGVVKLEYRDGTEIFVMSSAERVDALIAALEMARDHVWGTPWE